MPVPKRRRGWRRLLVFLGIVGLLYGLAVLVARPRVPDPVTNPYVGKRGASLAKSAGLEMRFRRGDELNVIKPETVLRSGDVLEFKVRGDGPAYLEVRMRDGAAAPVTLFPTSGADMAQVTPGDALPVTPVVAPGGGKLVVTALFSDRRRPLGAPPEPDTLVTTAVVSKE